MWPFRSKAGARRAGPWDLLPPAEARYAVIDSELTGLDPRRDSIVSLGGLRVTQGRIDLGDRFYEEARPAATLTPTSIVLHGITPEEARGRPDIGGILTDFAAFCGGDILVGHFLEIDVHFLRKELVRSGLPALENPALDTWALYEWLASRDPRDAGPDLPRVREPRLPELAQALGVPCRDAHNALDDAFVTAQVFQRLLRRLPRWGITTTESLLRIAAPGRGNGHPASLLPLA
jgi:DNA polymerase-3 subunit epsilon